MAAVAAVASTRLVERAAVAGDGRWATSGAAVNILLAERVAVAEVAVEAAEVAATEGAEGRTAVVVSSQRAVQVAAEAGVAAGPLVAAAASSPQVVLAAGVVAGLRVGTVAREAEVMGLEAATAVAGCSR